MSYTCCLEYGGLSRGADSLERLREAAELGKEGRPRLRVQSCRLGVWEGGDQRVGCPKSVRKLSGWPLIKNESELAL